FLIVRTWFQIDYLADDLTVSQREAKRYRLPRRANAANLMIHRSVPAPVRHGGERSRRLRPVRKPAGRLARPPEPLLPPGALLPLPAARRFLRRRSAAMYLSQDSTGATSHRAQPDAGPARGYQAPLRSGGHTGPFH